MDSAVMPSPAAYRAGRVLELMGRRGEVMTITEIARELSFAKSSVANLLTSLEAASMVRRAPQGWLLGYKVLELSRSMLSSTVQVSEFRRTVTSLPTLRQDTTLMAVLDGLDVIYIVRHEGQQPVRFINEIGSRAPAAVTSLGKAMLAALDPADLDRRLAGVTTLPRLTERSHRTVAELRADLDQIRTRGYAVDDEQGVPGVTCLGVAVTGLSTPCAVSVTLLARRMTPQLRIRLAADLVLLARHLSLPGDGTNGTDGIGGIRD